jgi:hypothetical protein
MTPVFHSIGNEPVEATLAERLNREFPADGELVHDIETACHQAIAEGWMCAQGGQGRRFGRVVEPSVATRDFSVDVVDLTDIVGPHHRHPRGEICLVMPVDPEARFMDGGRGWCVFGPGSDHRPTVAGGRALVLYLLPGGEIEFTKA